MQRNAETVAKINAAVATAGSGLWRAMLPGQVSRPKVTLKVVSRRTLPVGPAEFYCQLGRTRPNSPVHKCSPQLDSAAYRTMPKPENYECQYFCSKTTVDPKDWAMFKVTTRIRQDYVLVSTDFNITKIKIASWAQ